MKLSMKRSSTAIISTPLSLGNWMKRNTANFVLTGGGPGNATTFLSQYLTQKAVGQFDVGPAAAFSLIYFLIILLMCFVLYNWMQRVGQGDGPKAAHE